jgi:uncharacterized protein (TIGR02271 family)
MTEQPERHELAVPVVEEELVTGTREVKTGAIRVRKRVQHLRKHLEMPVVKDVLRIDRVPVNRVVKTIPPIREEDGILIVPVVEEQIVVSRRMVLKEEIHVIRKQVKETAARDVSLAKEHAVIERLDSRGAVVGREKTRRADKTRSDSSQPPSFFREKGIVPGS